MKRYEEHTLILEQDIDYNEDELIPDWLSINKLSQLPAYKLMQIAKNKGFDNWTWTGHVKEQEDNEHKVGIMVKFAKFI